MRTHNVGARSFAASCLAQRIRLQLLHRYTIHMNSSAKAWSKSRARAKSMNSKQNSLRPCSRASSARQYQDCNMPAFSLSFLGRKGLGRGGLQSLFSPFPPVQPPDRESYSGRFRAATDAIFIYFPIPQAKAFWDKKQIF